MGFKLNGGLGLPNKKLELELGGDDGGGSSTRVLLPRWGRGLGGGTTVIQQKDLCVYPS